MYKISKVNGMWTLTKQFKDRYGIVEMSSDLKQIFDYIQGDGDSCLDCSDTGKTTTGRDDNLIEIACHCTKGGDYAEVTDNPNYE